MYGNNGEGNISDRDDWETPNELYNKLNEQYEFVFDCCATHSNKKTNFLFTSDFLNMEKINVVAWMNPPFSKAYVMFEHFFKVINRGVAIYRCDNMETKVWQEHILKYADWILIPKGRITYQYNSQIRKGKGCRFPSALIGVGVEPPKNYSGKILFIKK